MRSIREVLKLNSHTDLTCREIACATGISKTSVENYVHRAQRAGLDWEQADQLGDVELERLLFPATRERPVERRAPIDLQWVHRELRRPGVTLQLLWTEYLAAVTAAGGGVPAYQYSGFCDQYATWRETLSPTMRQVHRAGERAFIDYSGKKPSIVEPTTGEVVEVELFVMVLGASNFTYLEATRTQGLDDFIGSHVRAFGYFGCVSHILVPDQLRSAVSKPGRHPVINRTYQEMAAHYGAVVVPARPRKPRDKAKVEAGVWLAQRWVLACLRNQVFFGLDELNAALAVLRERLNDRPFQKLEGCRRSAFETIDRPAMNPLPATRYVLAHWIEATVNVDYCIEYDHRPYSVPCTLVGQKVEVRVSASMVEILHSNSQVALHRRCYGPKGTPTILEAHRPANHRDYGDWPPERFLAWGRSIGPSVEQVIGAILQSRPRPELAYRSCLGLFRLAKKYDKARVEAACRRALAIGSPSRKSVETILARGLDRLPWNDTAPPPAVAHENIRGGSYFDKKEDHDARGDDPEVVGDEAAGDGVGVAGADREPARQRTLF
jgi:transposase